MVQTKQIITTEEDLPSVLKKLISQRRYHYIRIALPNSKKHTEKALPGDRLLVACWKCKDVERKKKEDEVKDDVNKKPA